jgi:hypothetical protein
MVELLFIVFIWTVVFGALYYVLTLLPLQQPFMNIAIAVLILMYIVIILQVTGVLSGWRVKGID